MANNHHPKDEAYLSYVIPKRIRLFEEIQAELLEQLQSRPHDPIKITLLPDGIVKEGKRWETTPMDIAVQISKGLAKSALVSSVNHVLWDMNRPLEGDCSVEIFGFDSDQGRDTFWHSSAHILGQALEQEYGCKLCIGPCKTIDEGFYYDAFYYGNLGLNDDHFPNIEAGVAKAVRERQPFERIEVTKDQALEMFSDNKFKVEIINNDLAEEEIITVYRCGPLVDLCPGPHIPNTSFVKAFKCLNASAAYWRGNSHRESLQRVYGISYPDHKQLKQKLIGSSTFSPGDWCFRKYGKRVYNKLIDFIKNEYWKRGYDEVQSQDMFNIDLWKISGHAEKYKKNMFMLNIDQQEFGLKPMNCPGHCLEFQREHYSYKELPIRMAEFGVLHRNEESGALSGMTRARRFVQDDAHIFCRVDQVGEELSTRPEKKYIGDLETWDKAEKDLEKALDNFGKPWVINKGDGAFYGPKIDITVSDAMKRKFQCATLQLDFQLPARFKLDYITEKNEKERPVMIHRAVLGSVERMFAILLEHYKGIWPFWLSPRQAIVCSLSEDYSSYAKQVQKQIHEARYYVDIDESDRSICKKVADARAAPYNYILVVGHKEATTGQVTVRLREDPAGRKDLPEMSIDSLLDEFKFKKVNFL
ncbi:Anticodon-binding [Arabidopsis thaliana x Arabidopsis arenosa]|uniref:threonine--tRNA ligase n=1 Tax=Arabidopsis thaliana x Arabidopsis arenosa TaxID=1240361 RepID=A0A8T2BWJ2_9BRAS|nr:Anticodon-binding [Arabidopsis thaliana x Arabidopsis arenosa]